MRYFYAQRRHRIGMVILLAFLLQIPLSAYSAFSYADTGSVVSTDVIEKITATKDGVELKDIENYRPVMGDEIDLRFDFTLPDKHPYEAGSTLTYTLPAPLKPANGSGELSNEAGETYATYGISEGNVVITFNENIRFQGEEGSGGLETKGWFEITAIFEADENNTALEQELTLPGSGTITLIFQPPGGEVIAKGVAPENSGNSSSYVQWTVDVNTVMDDLGGGKEFTDTLIGNHQYDPTSLKVTRLELGNDGSILSSRDVTEDYPQLAAGATSFTLNLTGKYAYKIEYRTIPGDTEDASQTIKNQAKFNGKTDSKSTTVTYGDPLAKTVSKSGETANWEIKVNGNRKNLAAGTTITDSWNSGKHALVPGTFKVNGSTDLPLGLTVVHSDQGFVLTLGQDINEEFTITYSTQPKDLVTENSDVTNEVKRSDREDKKTITAQYRQNVLSKTNSNINYQEKTVDWKIVLNSAGYNMANLVLEDTFVHKNLKIVDGTFKVQMNGKDLPYTRTDKDGDVAGDKKGGFTLNIPGPITAPVTVTYTTEYDVRGVDNLDKYANTVGLTWQTNDKEYSTTDVTSTVTINPQQKGKGYKTGTYNYETKKFQWSVGINYNFDTIKNPVFTDTLSDSQVVDRTSIKVHKLDLSGGGDGKISGEPLTEGEDYTLTPAELTNTFTITFKDTITDAYRIYYESRNKDDYYPPADKDHSVTNKAILSGADGYNADWTKTVTVKHTKNLITKGYKQEGKSAKLHWTIKLNWGQSELSDVVITDIVGQDAQENPNQMIYKDSFKIYEMKFTGSNNTPTRVEPGYSPGTIGDGLYYVTFDDPDSTFKIVFNEPITKAYTVEYDSYFLGASGDKLENQAKLTYKSKVTNNGEDEGNSSNASFTFTGGASAEKGQLEITKVDKDDPIKKLSGAVFELWSAKTGGFLIERVSTDNDGVYTFTTKVGRTDYYLIETKAPEGYSLDESPYKNLTKVTIGQPLQPLTVTNTKLVRAVTLKKVDKDDQSPLAGAQFKLYDANTHKQVEVKDTAGNIVPQPFETNEFGEITVGNLAPGTYYFEETAAPHHYLLPVEAARKTAEFTITDNQIKVIQVEMKNTRGIGKIIIKKVDGANNSPLKDVVFNLVKKFNDGSQVMTATTNEDGIAEFRDLPYDTYILTEEKPHSGYALLTPQEVALDGEQDAVELALTIKNNKKDHSVKLTKYNANKTLTLKGAVFELRKETNGVYEVVPGITAEQLTTDDNGALSLKDLPAGKYHLIETKAPAGYRLNSDPVAFEIEENQIAAIQLEKTNSRISSGGGGGGGVNPSDPKDPGDTDKPKDPDPKQPQEPEDPAGPSTPGTPPGGGNESGGGGNPSEDFGINEGLPLGDTNANKTLPKTGENSYLPFYLLGFALLILGAGIGRKRV